jgi:hypothetical protein
MQGAPPVASALGGMDFPEGAVTWRADASTPARPAPMAVVTASLFLGVPLALATLVVAAMALR